MILILGVIGPLKFFLADSLHIFLIFATNGSYDLFSTANLLNEFQPKSIWQIRQTLPSRPAYQNKYDHWPIQYKTLRITGAVNIPSGCLPDL